MTPPSTTREQLLKAIDRMGGISVLVIADLVLDEFEYGEIDRISREAPVLILTHRRTDRLPGGGANAANNVAALDGRPVIVGRVGEDEAGERLIALLRERGADTARIWRDAAYVTPLKRRVLAGSAHSVKQQIVRIDRGGGAPVSAAGSPLLPSIQDALTQARGALISDYSLGMLHAGTIGPVLDAVRASGRPLTVDSRSQIRLFRGVAAATPNLQEAESALGERVGDDPQKLARAGTALREAIDADTILVTRGSQGMSVFTRDADPAHLRVYGTDEVADVTGAGDTVVGVLTLALLGGAGPLEAAMLANYAGGIVVMKRGTATVSREELRSAVRSDPALSPPRNRA
ncbi:MAG TPA: PfkB family carbohydrate kinase [Candidatus Polarisedimenticolia bacterium]|nr:PfkB family carbohydrate kinase [Candidatus Polarisedimenticolia bacterium]